MQKNAPTAHRRAALRRRGAPQAREKIGAPQARENFEDLDRLRNAAAAAAAAAAALLPPPHCESIAESSTAVSRRVAGQKPGLRDREWRPRGAHVGSTMPLTMAAKVCGCSAVSGDSLAKEAAARARRQERVDGGRVDDLPTHIGRRHPASSKVFEC